MPPKFGMIAALQGDLDTSDGVGKVFFRQDSSPGVLSQAAEHINRAFPEDPAVSPTHAVVVTWAEAAPHAPQSRGDSLDRKVSSIITSCFAGNGDSLPAKGDDCLVQGWQWAEAPSDRFWTTNMV